MSRAENIGNGNGVGPYSRRSALAAATAAGIVSIATPTWADRPIHGSLGGGTSFLLTGAQGDRNRFELEADLEPPNSRYGGFVAWRAVDDKHHGMLLGGLVYEGAASRPRLVVDLHADGGADLDQKAPVLGGGIRTTLTAWRMLGIGLDLGAYLVIDGVEDTRLVIASSASAVLRW